MPVGPAPTVAVKVTSSPYVDGEPELATVNIGVVAFNCRIKVSETVPAFAVIVTDSAFPTDNTVAVNTAVVALSGTVTEAGTVTSVLLLDRFTLSPPEGAAALRVTVHESAPEPVVAALAQESALNAGVVVPPLVDPDEPWTVSEFV